MKSAPLRIGIAAAWRDVETATYLAHRLSGPNRLAELICAGASENQPAAPPPDVVLVLWSPSAATSLFVKRAADDARRRGRLVEARLQGLAPGADREASPLMLGPRPSAVAIARIRARLMRAASGRPQQSAVLALAGPIALAAMAAAVAAPFLWLAAQTSPPQIAAASSDDRPKPSHLRPPAERRPESGGMGGPLIPGPPP